MVTLSGGAGILSWRSKQRNLKDGGYVAELQCCDEEKEQYTNSSRILPDSDSVQDLIFLFSKLSLYDSAEDIEIMDERQDDSNSVSSASEWCFSSSLRDKMHVNFENSKYIQHEHHDVNIFTCSVANNLKRRSLHSLPGFHEMEYACKRTNIKSRRVENTFVTRSDFHGVKNENYCFVEENTLISFLTVNPFIDHFNFFYQYRSRFWLFLKYILARAGRLIANFETENIHKASLIEKESVREMHSGIRCVSESKAEQVAHSLNKECYRHLQHLQKNVRQES